MEENECRSLRSCLSFVAVDFRMVRTHTHTHTSKVAIDGSTPRISFVARAIFIDINVVKDDRA